MNKIALEYQNNVRYIGKISENWKWNFVETIFCLFCIFNISYFFPSFQKQTLKMQNGVQLFCKSNKYFSRFVWDGWKEKNRYNRKKAVHQKYVKWYYYN